MCVHVYVHVCMHTRMCVCTYVCMNECMYIRMYVFVYREDRGKSPWAYSGALQERTEVHFGAPRGLAGNLVLGPTVFPADPPAGEDRGGVSMSPFWIPSGASF